MQAMARFIKSLQIPLVGLFVVFIGLLYDLWFAGLPYQDPTPEMQAKWNLHNNIANMIMGAGLALCFGGLMAALFIWLRRSRHAGK